MASDGCAAFLLAVLARAASLGAVLGALALAWALSGRLRGYGGRGRWREATLHAYLPGMALARWAHFRWKHPDCLYWILPVRFDQGEILVEGRENDCLYWSLTYYCWTEVNPGVSSRTVPRAPDGRYQVRLGKGLERGPTAIPVAQDAVRGVLYLRVYEPRHLFPTRLPRVVVGGRELVGEGLA